MLSLGKFEKEYTFSIGKFEINHTFSVGKFEMLCYNFEGFGNVAKLQLGLYPHVSYYRPRKEKPQLGL